MIDTPGAEISPAAEEGGLAREIAECLAAMSALRVPSLSLLLGEGSGGGALALLPADRVVAAEHAWLAPIQPEGASAILHRTTGRARELAAAQAILLTSINGARELAAATKVWRQFFTSADEVYTTGLETIRDGWTQAA